MMKSFRCTVLAALVSLALGAAALAQTPPSGAWISGTVTAVSSDAMTIQGLTLGVADGAKFVTVRQDGTIAPIAFNQIQQGDPFRGRFILLNNAPTLVYGEVSNHFFWHGTVTAVTETTITMDGLMTISTGQAKLVGSGTLAVGATVGVNGQVLNGVYAATVINTNGFDFHFTGVIASVSQDGGGNVAGFTFGKGSASYFVALDANSLVWRGRHQVSPNTLAAGARVEVRGWTQPDGSILAWNIWIKGR